jgi:hypothetical protein
MSLSPVSRASGIKAASNTSRDSVSFARLRSLRGEDVHARDGNPPTPEVRALLQRLKPLLVPLSLGGGRDLGGGISISRPPVPERLSPAATASLTDSPIRMIDDTSREGRYNRIVVDPATRFIMVRRGPTHVLFDQATDDEKTIAIQLLTNAVSAAESKGLIATLSPIPPSGGAYRR